MRLRRRRRAPRARAVALRVSVGGALLLAATLEELELIARVSDPRRPLLELELAGGGRLTLELEERPASGV